jgi:hypothetical protein
MKKYWFLTGLLASALLLSACGNAGTSPNVQSGSTAQSNSAADPSAQGSNGQLDMPVSLKLALGTLNLDGSDQEVSADEATALLPLWKAVRSLGDSDTVAVEEMNALYDQIHETMTPEQVAAIDQMQLTRESMGEIAQKLGIELFGNGGRFGTFTPEMQATAQAARESGQFPEGNFPVPPEGGFPGGGSGGGPGGGGGFGGNFQGGGNLTPEQQATMTARRAANGNRVNIGVPSALLDALIQYLEGKTG